MAEFREGVGQIDKNCSALQLVTRIHTLSGLAAVSGWTDSHSILTTAETQAKTGDFEAAMKSVERARLALGPEYPPSRH